ncbi:MAG: transporter ATP-binding protein [Herbinix sp.]|nr:transporter ATP-binding protein [Herbinix sp.]
MKHEWWVGLVILVVCIPMFWLAMKAGKETYAAHKDAQIYFRRAAYLQGVLLSRENVEERSLFGYTDELNNEWLAKFESSRIINQNVRQKHFIRMKGASLITVFISLFIIGMMLIPIASGDMTIGVFMALAVATLDLVQDMSWRLSRIVEQVVNGKEYLNDLTVFCSLSEADGALDLPIRPKDFRFENIEFINVSFQYPNTENYILKDFSLKLEKNRHYAFVGINGAGKTTITKLLTGMYDNFDGEILINGKSIREYNQAHLKGLFAVVYQDLAKYYITMKDNIALGNLVETDNETKIRDAANMIGLKEVIDKLKDGINSWVGKIKQGGIDLSGGEWQRVAIARALYNPAQIRILDEPTAALDPVAESNIYELFGRISAGKSSIFITHRLGAAKLADEIIVIDEGRVKEKGNHEMLLKQKGIYAEMFEVQRSWYR